MRDLAAILAVALLSASCGGTGPTHAYTVTSSPAAPILMVSQSGGFVTIEFHLKSSPLFALYGDGRVIVSDPNAGSSSKVMPDLRQFQLTPAQIQTLLAAADADGLLGPDRRYQTVGTNDAGDTSFTTVADGGAHKISVYALEYSSEYPIGDASDQAAVARLLDFYGKITDLPKFLGGAVSDQPYQPAEMRVYARQIAAANGNTAAGAPKWPLAVDLSSGLDVGSGLRCVVLGGSDVQTFTRAAADEGDPTTWSTSTGSFDLFARPLYPDEHGCSA
jgi:hypothetical protein